jgi:hypothetical protein
MKRVFVFAIAIAVVLGGCVDVGTVVPSPTPTATPTETLVPTATYTETVVPSPTPTATPTETWEPCPPDELMLHGEETLKLYRVRCHDVNLLLIEDIDGYGVKSVMFVIPPTTLVDTFILSSTRDFANTAFNSCLKGQLNAGSHSHLFWFIEEVPEGEEVHDCR